MIALIQFTDRNILPIQILYSTEWKLQQIIEKLKNQLKERKIEFDANDYKFFYNNHELTEDSSLADLNNNGEIMIISVITKSRVMKCPQCICNNCYIYIENFCLNFSECKYQNHKSVTFLDNYENMQKIDFGQIECHKCKKSLKDDLKDFYKCLHCSKKFKCTFYLCEDHKMTHKEDGGAKHKLIKYDEKYYFCSDHFTQYVSYCNTCNLNLCEMGEKSHKDKKHDVIKLESYDTKVKATKSVLEDIKNKTLELKIHIDQIKNMLDNVVKIFDQYYYISTDLIKKFETYNSKFKNFQVLKTVKNLSESSETFVNYLDEILNPKNDWIGKCKKILDIFIQERERYATGGKIEDNNNNYVKTDGSTNGEKIENNTSNGHKGNVKK